MLYLVVVFSAVMMVLMLWVYSKEEMSERRSVYQKKFHAALRLHGVPDPVTEQPTMQKHDIYRNHIVIGRRKRKCDVCLSVYDDEAISREHAVIWYDGKTFHLKPVYRPKSGRYTRIWVLGQLVPPEGVPLKMGQIFYIEGHELELVDTSEV